MDARLQRRVQRYGWDLAAAHYERAWTAPLAPMTQALLQQVALVPGEHVLDVACGPGQLTRAALRAVQPGGQALGTDLSVAMVAAAAAVSPGCRFVPADAEALDQILPAEAFDAVLCGLGLMYMPDPAAAVAAMRRRLRPGGRLVVSVWGERRLCGWAALFPIVDARVRSEVCPLFFSLGGGDALGDLLRDDGLEDVQTSRLAVTLDFADADAACDAAFCGGPVALAHARFDEATRTAVRAEYLAAIEPWRSGEAYRLPGAFVTAVGWRR